MDLQGHLSRRERALIEAETYLKAAAIAGQYGINASFTLYKVAAQCQRVADGESTTVEPVEDGVEHTLDALARMAYNAYGESTGWRNFQGNPMPAFDALGQSIQDAWVAAATAVLDADDDARGADDQVGPPDLP